jgi:hypothetical protein
MSDNIKHKLELIKMARELLNEEYINRRAQDHNKWLAECDVAWRTKGIKLPYPPFAPYPTEAEIIAKASSLYNFIASGEENKEDLTKKEVESVKQIFEQPVVPEQPAESPWVTYLTTKEPEVAANTEVNSTATVSTETPVPEEEVKDHKPLFSTPADQQLTINQELQKGVRNILPSWLQPKAK